MDDLGKRLRALRLSRTLTQAQLGTKAAVGRTTIAGVENGGRHVSLHSLRSIAQPLQLQPEEWTALLIDWLRVELGDEFYRLQITSSPKPLPGPRDEATEELVALLPRLSTTAVEQLLTIAKHPAVLPLAAELAAQLRR